MHPSRSGTYDSITMHPFETVFIKASWHVGEPFTSHYTKWFMGHALGQVHSVAASMIGMREMASIALPPVFGFVHHGLYLHLLAACSTCAGAFKAGGVAWQCTPIPQFAPTLFVVIACRTTQVAASMSGCTGMASAPRRSCRRTTRAATASSRDVAGGVVEAAAAGAAAAEHPPRRQMQRSLKAAVDSSCDPAAGRRMSTAAGTASSCGAAQAAPFTIVAAQLAAMATAETTVGATYPPVAQRPQSKSGGTSCSPMQP